MDTFIILTYLLLFICYLLFIIHLTKRALRLTRSGRIIAYIIITGAIVNIIGILSDKFHIQSIGRSLNLIGFLIFLFGFILLLYEEFKEGASEVK